MARKKEIEMVPLSQIEADKAQPRRNFDAERLNDLKRSIEKYGIKNPLIVETMPSGKYLLQDGERRYRAATELKLKEVPVIVEEAQGDLQRLMIQFHLQEQHQGWSPLEKAMGVGRLADELGVPINELATRLSLPPRSVKTFLEFSKILEKDDYVKFNIPLHYVNAINKLKVYVKRQYRDVLNEEFGTPMQSLLEKSIFERIVRGEIKYPVEITRLHDSVKVNPKSIEKFMTNAKMTIDKLFIESNAKTAWYYRNIINQSNVLASHAKIGTSMGVQEMFKDQEAAVNTIKRAYKELGNLIKVL